VAGNAESLIVRADMSAFEFHQAAWEACEGGTTQPDPATLSDRALYVVMKYEDRDLPSDARQALEVECRHRGLFPDRVDRLVGLGLMAFVALSGSAIGWMLFAS
jgi:hypothetical protein